VLEKGKYVHYSHSERAVYITAREHVPVEILPCKRFTQNNDETSISFHLYFLFYMFVSADRTKWCEYYRK
jgi:hypothetical protein